MLKTRTNQNRPAYEKDEELELVGNLGSIIRKTETWKRTWKIWFQKSMSIQPKYLNKNKTRACQYTTNQNSKAP